MNNRPSIGGFLSSDTNLDLRNTQTNHDPNLKLSFTLRLLYLEPTKDTKGMLFLATKAMPQRLEKRKKKPAKARARARAQRGRELFSS